MTEIWRSRTVGGDSAAGQVHLGHAAVAGERELAVIGAKFVDVNGSIGGLCRNKFIEGVPCDALDIVTMLGDLANDGA